LKEIRLKKELEPRNGVDARERWRGFRGFDSQSEKEREITRFVMPERVPRTPFTGEKKNARTETVIGTALRGVWFPSRVEESAISKANKRRRGRCIVGKEKRSIPDFEINWGRKSVLDTWGKGGIEGDIRRMGNKEKA